MPQIFAAPTLTLLSLVEILILLAAESASSHPIQIRTAATVGNFFFGWKRKLGVIMLLMSCLFMAGWVRSLGEIDVIHVPLGNHHEIAFSSGGYSLACRAGWDEEGNEFLDWETQPASNYDPSRRFSAIIDIGFDDPIQWFGKWAGFGIGVTPPKFRHFLREVYMIIPYWMITIPQTLVAGLLILARPLKSIQKTILEPASESVA